MMFKTLFFSIKRTTFYRKTIGILSRLVSASYRKVFKIKPAIREDITTPRSLLTVPLRKLGLVIFIAIPIQISGLLDSYLVARLTDLLSWLMQRNAWLMQRNVTITNNFDSGTLLASIIGVGGVFIGLYYAAISSVCSAIYANKPNNIRNLLAQDRVSSFYMDWLAKITVFGVFFLALNTLGIQPSMIAMLLLILGAVWMIIGFIQLGRRVLNLFDPTTLSDSIIKTLKNCSSKMVASGYHWSNPILQSEAYRQSQIALDTITTLSDITAEAKNLNGRPFAELCKKLLLFLSDYETRRKLIPTESLWYRQQYEHPDWYRAGDTETSFAYETSAGLQPKIVRDSRWIESSILPIVKSCLEINLREKRYAIVNELLSNFDYYIRQIAGEHQLEYAVDRISDMFTWCEKFIFADDGKIVDKESLEHMEICERLAIMPINVLVSYFNATVSYYGQHAIPHHFHDIRWETEKSIYKAGFAEHALKEIEQLRPRLEFEKKVEGKIISEPWYIQKIITQTEAENISTAIACFYEMVPKLYDHWIKTTKSSRHPWLEATIITREMEYWNELDRYTPILHQFWNELNPDEE